MEGLTKLGHVTSGENFMAHNELVSGQFPILNTKTNHDAINSLIDKITVKISVAFRLRDCTPSDGQGGGGGVSHGPSPCETRRGGGGYQGNQSL